MDLGLSRADLGSNALQKIAVETVSPNAGLAEHLTGSLVSFGEMSMVQQLPIDEEWRQQVLTSFERIHRAVSEHDEDGARAAMALHRSESDRVWNTRDALAHVPLGPFEFGR